METEFLRQLDARAQPMSPSDRQTVIHSSGSSAVPHCQTTDASGSEEILLSRQGCTFGAALPIKYGGSLSMLKDDTATTTRHTTCGGPAECGDIDTRYPFSPHSTEFKPRECREESPSGLAISSPESATSDIVTQSPEGGDDGSQWTLTSDGQLIKQSATSPMGYDGNHGPATHTIELMPTARPWSPTSVIPYADPCAPQITVDTSNPADATHRLYCAGKLGEPDDSFPFAAFSTWRQRKLVATVSSPPTPSRGLGHGRVGSQDSTSSQASSPSPPCIPQPPMSFNSPRAAFAHFEAVQHRHSFPSSPQVPGSSSDGAFHLHHNIVPPAGKTYNGGHFPHGRSTDLSHTMNCFDNQQSGSFLAPSTANGTAQNSMTVDNPFAALCKIASQAATNPELSQAVMRLANLQADAGVTSSVAAPPPPPPAGGPSPHNRKLGLYKTELCRSWEEKGSCRYGPKCQFAHGRDELRQTLRSQKTDTCRAFDLSGSCPYGSRGWSASKQYQPIVNPCSGCIFRHERGSATTIGSPDRFYYQPINVPLVGPRLSHPYLTAAKNATSGGHVSPSLETLHLKKSKEVPGRHADCHSITHPWENAASEMIWQSSLPPRGSVGLGIDIGTTARVQSSRSSNQDAALPADKPNGILADLRDEDDEPYPWPLLTRSRQQHPFADPTIAGCAPNQSKLTKHSISGQISLPLHSLPTRAPC